jgi:phospholipase C
VRIITRRAFLAGTGALAAGALARGAGGLADAGLTVPWAADQAAALAALGRTVLRGPDSLPNPAALPGTPDPALAGIEHVVVCMLENHSYDNVFGCLPPARRFTVDGTSASGLLDGLSMANPLGDSGQAWNPYGVTDTNPYVGGRTLNAFQMPSTVQLADKPSQEWAASHLQYDGGTCRGFALSPSGPVAMGYWAAGFPASSPYGAVAGLPFTYALAQTFPVADRWFAGVLGQTDPNRRFLVAGTANGMTDDIAFPTSASGIEGLLGQSAAQLQSTAGQDALLLTPANGTIFDRFEAFGISWCDYTASYPFGTTAELYPVDDAAVTALRAKPLDTASSATVPFAPGSSTFFEDCAAGRLPQFSLLDMDYSTQSQENPQDVAVGEALLARVVDAVVGSPLWPRTLLVVTYVEHGGYYDHVAPPAALAPDAVAPVVAPGESVYDGFRRYGFRVPALVVSPFAVANGVTHVVHDHTSVLAMVERMWNLPALTFRDANANDLTDFLDMAALRRGWAAATIPAPGPFPAPGPSVPGPLDSSGALDPAAVPPPEAVR